MEDNQGIGLEQPIRSEPLVAKTWPEIRASFVREPYSSFAKTMLDYVRDLRLDPNIRIPADEWNRDVDLQIKKARELPKEKKFKGAGIYDSGTKISVIGRHYPEHRKGVLTRIYIGLDPRKAADAFEALVEELDRDGVLSEINSALNMEELGKKILAENSIILYEPLSRPEILDRIMQAYNKAKARNPQAFDLTPNQRATIIRENLRGYKAILDQNLSFVEIAEEDGPVSYDSGVIAQTHWVFNIHPLLDKMPDEEWLSRIRQREAHVVFTEESRRRLDSGEVKTGDKLDYKRKLSAPSLIQKGFIVAK